MPVVQVTMIGNKSADQKRRLLADLTKVVVDDLDVPPASVNVVLHEVPTSAWAHAGVPLSEALGD